MPIAILKAYYSEMTDGSHTVRFLCGSEEEHSKLVKEINADERVVICLSQYVCAADVDSLLYPPQPVKGEDKLRAAVAHGLHEDDDD